MTIEERLTIIENDIAELKEAVAELANQPAVVGETLIDALQVQVSQLAVAQANTRTLADATAARVDTLEAEASTYLKGGVEGTTLIIKKSTSEEAE